MCICMAAGRKIVIKLPYYRSRKGRIGRGGGGAPLQLWGGDGLGSRKGQAYGV